MGRAGLIVAWLASVAVLAAPWIFDTGPERFAGVSFFALAALPWVAWLGAPRASASGASHGTLAACAALPPLGVAAALDAQQGASAARVASIALAACLAALALWIAAERARSEPRTARAHAIAWFALVALPAPAAWALGAGGAPFLGEVPRALAALARSGPIGWLLARSGDAATPADLPLAPLAIALAVLVVAEAARARWKGDAGGSAA